VHDPVCYISVLGWRAQLLYRGVASGRQSSGGCWDLWALSRPDVQRATESCDHGPDAVPPGAPVGIAVRLCGAAELCAALQLMQARLHPELAQVPLPCGRS
jgi:hypothetical protein